jgi:DUF2075 family protein
LRYLIADQVGRLAQLSPDDLVNKMLPPDSTHNFEEQRSWRESLYRLIQIVNTSGLSDLWLIAEYSLIGTHRIDAIICGFSRLFGRPLALIVESKQWNKIGDGGAQHTDQVKMNFANEYRMHPVAQMFQYEHQLEANHSVVKAGNIQLAVLAFMHNLPESQKPKLFTDEYRAFAQYAHLVFVKDDEARLTHYLGSLFKKCSGEQTAKQFLAGHYELSRADFFGITKILQRKDNAVMLADQIEVSLAFDQLCAEFKKNPRHMAMIIQGSAGTGKTIVGLHLEYLAVQRHLIPLRRTIFTFAKSRMLHNILGQAMSASGDPRQLPYLDMLSEHDYSLVIIDEAHRMSDVPQHIYTLVGPNTRPKILVFLVDDHQCVHVKECGTEFVLKCALLTAGITPVCKRLTVQKRCGFENHFTAVLRHLFFDEQTPSQEPAASQFQVTITDSLSAIDKRLKAHQEHGFSARWFAPMDWLRRRSREFGADDIFIRDHDGQEFSKEWHPYPHHLLYEWYKSQSAKVVDQVGSIYCAQGLDYDYTGFIWNDSLRWDARAKRWVYCEKEHQDLSFKLGITDALKVRNFNFPSGAVTTLVMNQYYILLSRARRGTYIWFKDAATKRHVYDVLHAAHIL